MDAVSSAAGSRIETDKLGVDVLVTSTQKALALPPAWLSARYPKSVRTHRLRSQPRLLL